MKYTQTYQDDLFDNIRTTKDQVEYILKRFPETRNSDSELLKRYCSIYHTEPYDVFEKVKRNRQKLNEEKKYLPTSWEVAKQRGINQEVWKAAMGYANALF